MAQINQQKLDSRAPLPPLSYDLVGGGVQVLPASQWSVVLFYRGYW